MTLAQSLEKLTDAKLEELGAKKGWRELKISTQTKRYRSDALRSLHEVAADLHDVGVIDKATMRHFDLSCLTPVEVLVPEAIKHNL